jgi:histidine triad (HIT) family protein
VDYAGTDFYCDVALRGLVPLRRQYESERVLAFHHTKPFWPVHIVVVPKKHIASFTALQTDEMSIFLEIVDVLKSIPAKVEQEHGAARVLTNLGFRSEQRRSAEVTA